MPIIRDFTYCIGQFSDGYGLLPFGMDNADPGTGRTVAHDVLEHLDFSGDPLENELQALGALFLLRYESGAQRPAYSIPLSTMLARNIVGALQEYLRCPAMQPPRRRRVLGRSDLPQSVMDEAVTEAFDLLQETSRFYEFWDSAEYKAVLNFDRQAIADWLLVGYQRATRRYAQSDTCSVGSLLFDRLARAADDLLATGLLQPGDTVRVRVDPRYFQVQLKVRPCGASRWHAAENYF